MGRGQKDKLINIFKSASVHEGAKERMTHWGKPLIKGTFVQKAIYLIAIFFSPCHILLISVLWLRASSEASCSSGTTFLFC